MSRDLLIAKDVVSRGVVFTLLCLTFTAHGFAIEVVDKIDFAHDILPILKNHCAQCHTNGVYKGGLSVETRGQLIDSGTVRLGNHKASDLFDRLISDEDGYQMPPADEAEPLSKEQIKKMARWIDEGLDWPEEISLRRPVFRRSLQLAEVDVDTSTGQHPIDVLLSRYFDERGIDYPELLSDRRFLRRAKLDLLGLLPTPAEVLAFEQRNGSKKVETQIQELLSQDKDYAGHWMSFWNDLLRNDYAGTGYIDGGRAQITTWLHRSLIENKHYDQMVRELINPNEESAGFIKGIKWRGRVNASQIQPLQFSQNISQVFLGINMKCASCHDSFIDDWKLEDAYGLAAISSEQPLAIHRCDVPTGETAKSKFVFGSLGQIDHQLPKQKRLAKLAELMTLPENGRFSRTIVNRLWHRMTGRGLVHPVDVMANKAWSETILDFLARDLIEHDYDLKRTLFLITTSRIYRSESVPSKNPVATESDYVFRGVSAKRMTAEQFVDSVWRLSGAGPLRADANVSTVIEPAAPLPGKWIWNETPARQSKPNETVYFRKLLDIPQLPAKAFMMASCDNEMEIWLNGHRVIQSKSWQAPEAANLKPYLKTGRNILIAKGTNFGPSPNPAGFYALVALIDSSGRKTEIATSEKWEYTNTKVSPLGETTGADQAVWAAAQVIPKAWNIYGQIAGPGRAALAQLESGQGSGVRASLVKADLLMRALGRPNREQVVTTRPESLSTLQALDLSNGDILAGWLTQGASRWQQRQQANGWTDSQLIRELFAQALTREPDPEELDLLQIGTEERLQSLEDILWLVVMLPEFQLIE